MSGSTTATKHLSGESLAVAESSTWHGTSSNRGLQILILKLPDLWTLWANPRRVGEQSEQKHRHVSESGGGAKGIGGGRHGHKGEMRCVAPCVCELSCATAARAGDDAASLVPIPLLFSSLLFLLLILFSFVWMPLVFQGLFKLIDSMRGFVSRLAAGAFNFSLLLVAKPNQTKPALLNLGGRRRRIYYLLAINFSLYKHTACAGTNKCAKPCFEIAITH